jgi:ABC-type Fe3+-hydroxamate transport system substrate-binding protein
VNIKIISVVSFLILLSGLSAVTLSDTSEGAVSFTITDGEGGSFVYTSPTERIVTMGYASTLTVAMLGEIDKIIAVDMYSTYEYTNDERLKDLNATNLGSIYSSSNNDKIVVQFIQWVEEGKMKLNDTIILTTYQNAKVLRDKLNEFGFSKVLVYLSVSTYDDIVKVTRDISMIVTGGVSKVVEDMVLVKKTIEDGLEGVTEKRKGLSVWYNASSGFSVNTTGSLSVSLIGSAGGISIAAPPTTSSTRYGNVSTVVQLLAENPDTVVFLSDTYTRQHTISDFRAKYLGGNENITIISVNSNWNNYCPDAAEGLWAFACAMYPDLFEGPMPETDERSNPNVLMYLFAGIIAAMIMLAFAYFLMRGL